jgi:hypothetical protein
LDHFSRLTCGFRPCFVKREKRFQCFFRLQLFRKTSIFGKNDILLNCCRKKKIAGVLDKPEKQTTMVVHQARPQQTK